MIIKTGYAENTVVTEIGFRFLHFGYPQRMAAPERAKDILVLGGAIHVT